MPIEQVPYINNSITRGEAKTKKTSNTTVPIVSDSNNSTQLVDAFTKTANTSNTNGKKILCLNSNKASCGLLLDSNGNYLQDFMFQSDALYDGETTETSKRFNRINEKTRNAALNDLNKMPDDEFEKLSTQQKKDLLSKMGNYEICNGKLRSQPTEEDYKNKNIKEWKEVDPNSREAKLFKSYMNDIQDTPKEQAKSGFNEEILSFGEKKWLETNQPEIYVNKENYFLCKLGGLSDDKGNVTPKFMHEVMNDESYKNANYYDRTKILNNFYETTEKGIYDWANSQFADYDANGDGQVSIQEVIENEIAAGGENMRPLAEKFANALNFDNDQNITTEELAAYVSLLDSNSGVDINSLDGKFDNYDFYKVNSKLINQSQEDSRQLLKEASEALQNLSKYEYTVRDGSIKGEKRSQTKPNIQTNIFESLGKNSKLTPEQEKKKEEIFNQLDSPEIRAKIDALLKEHRVN